MSKREFITKALIDDDTHKHFWWTHTEEFPPIFGPGYKEDQCPQTTASKLEEDSKEKPEKNYGSASE